MRSSNSWEFLTLRQWILKPEITIFINYVSFIERWFCILGFNHNIFTSPLFCASIWNINGMFQEGGTPFLGGRVNKQSLPFEQMFVVARVLMPKTHLRFDTSRLNQGLPTDEHNGTYSSIKIETSITLEVQVWWCNIMEILYNMNR